MRRNIMAVLIIQGLLIWGRATEQFQESWIVVLIPTLFLLAMGLLLLIAQESLRKSKVKR